MNAEFGMKNAEKKKPPINYHYRNIVRLTPRQHADLLSLCQEWGYTLSETTRKCLQIVSEMSKEERTKRWMRSKGEKDE